MQSVCSLGAESKVFGGYFMPKYVIKTTIRPDLTVKFYNYNTSTSIEREPVNLKFDIAMSNLTNFKDVIAIADEPFFICVMDINNTIAVISAIKTNEIPKF